MKQNLVYFLLALLVGILLGVSLIYLTKAKRNYVAVFLMNGNIYFGKLSTFPRLKLDNAIFLQVDQSGQVSFQRFGNAFWMPIGPIYFNKDAILFIAPINESSPVVNLIEGKTASQSSPPQPSQPTSPQTIKPATSSQ